jgi:hypothetical protein
MVNYRTMQKTTESHNTNVGAVSKQYLLPSVSQLLLYMLSGLMVLLILNVKKAWDYLNETVLVPQGGADQLIASNSPTVHRILDSLAHSIILQVIFWVLVGCLVYMIIWFVRNVAVNLLNDFVADNYMHPKSYKRTNYWSSILARKIFFWTSAVILVFFVLSSIKLLAYLASTLYINIVDFTFPLSIFKLLEILLATTGLIYTLILLSHVVINSWRLISRDL